MHMDFGNQQVLIKSVEWIETNSPLAANEGRPGGGLRIFPEQPAPNLLTRDTVMVRITLTRAIASVPIFATVIDVDDPSSRDPVIHPRRPASTLSKVLLSAR